MARYRLSSTAGLLSLAWFCLCAGPAAAASITSRSDHTATLLPDRTILVIGGLDGSGPPAPMTSVQLLAGPRGFDLPALNSVAGGVARASHTATLLPNGEVLVVGGQTTAGGAITNTAQIYNPIKNCWHTAIRAMPGRPRVGHTATLLRTGAYAGSVLVCGGRQTAGAGAAGDYWQPCDIFQPVTTPAANLLCAASPGDFVPGVNPNIQLPRAFHSAAMLPDGRVFFAGGYAPLATPVPYTSTTEIYNPNSGAGTFTSAYPLSQGRAFHTATLMGDGKVFIAGGFDGQDVVDNAEVDAEPFPSRNRGFLRSTEIYDPVSDHTSFAGTMIVRKMMHAISLQNDGQLVSWGGVGNLLNSYENAISYQIADGSVTLNCPARTINVTDFHVAGRFELKPFSNIPGYLVNPDPAGVIENGDFYMTINPEAEAPVDPFIAFSAGDVLFTAASPGAGTGLRASLAGARVTCRSAFDCGWVDRRTDLLHMTNGAGVVEFAAQPTNVTAYTINSANLTWSGAWTPSTPNEEKPLDASTIVLSFTANGLPKQLLGATISNLSLTIAGLQVNESISGSPVYRFALGSINTVLAGPLGPVTLDAGTDSGQLIFNNISFNIAPAATNKVTISTDALNPNQAAYNPPRGDIPAEVANMTLSGGACTFGANYCASQLVFSQATTGVTLNLEADLGVSIVDRMSFSDVEMFSPGGNTPLTWRYTGHGSGSNRQRHTMTLSPGGTPVYIGGVACDPAAWNATCPVVPVPTQSATSPPTVSTGAFTVISETAFATEGGAMSSKRANHTTTLLPNGDMLMAGGSNGPNILDSSEIFRRQTKNFADTAGRMHETRSLHTATLLPNGRVLVAGGYSTNSASTGAIAGSEVYYPDTQVWASSSAMNSPRNNHTATLLPDGNVLVVGGYANGTYLNSAEVYFSTAQAWLTVAPLPGGSERALHTATLLKDGRVMVIGGQNALGVINTYNIYDPNQNNWTAAAFINPSGGNVSVRYHTATLLADGQVLVAGGNDGSWETDRVMMYDPNPGGGWRDARVLPVGRERHTATLLPNGNIAVIGGAQAVALGGQPNPSVEIYDPTTGRWSEWEGGMILNSVRYSLPAQRAYHTTTLGLDGKLYVVGGKDVAGNVNTVLSHFHMAAGHDDNTTGAPPSNRISSVAVTNLSPFERGETLVVSGRNFLGVTEASGGGAASANSDQRHPILTLQAVDGSGGNASQGNSGYILDLTTRVFENSTVNTWDVVNNTITVVLPGAPGTIPPVAGSDSALLPYGWYRLHTAANDQFSPSYMVQAGPHLPAAPVTGIDAYPAPANVGVSSVTYSWVPPAGLVPGVDFSGYNVYTATTGVFRTTVPYSATSVTFNKLPGSSAQRVIVQPYNISGDNPTLTLSATVYTLPWEPTHVVLATAADNTFYVHWDTYSVETGTGNFAGTLYQLTQSTSPTFDPILVTYTPTQDNFAPPSPIPLAPNTTYYFRVKACNRHGSPGECSAYGWDRDLVNQYVSTRAFAAVTGLYGVSYATDTIDWHWTSLGSGVIYQMINSTVPYDGVNFTHVIANNINTNSYKQRGRLQNQRVVSQVLVQAGGPLSDSATAYSLAMPPVWTGVSCPDSAASEITVSSVAVEWNTQPTGQQYSGGAGPENNRTTYEVQYATANWDRGTGLWYTDQVFAGSVINLDNAIASHKLSLQSINPAVPLYVRARALNTSGNYLDRTVNPEFNDPLINPNGGWVNLISNVDTAAYTSTLQKAPTALAVIEPKGPSSVTLWWMDPAQAQWLPNSSWLGYPKYGFEVKMTTCTGLVLGSVEPQFDLSTGPQCGITPTGASAADLPFPASQVTINNLNAWTTYYFTLTTYNRPHYDANNPTAISTVDITGVPPVPYYTSIPGAVAGTIIVDVSARYGGSISSATVGTGAGGAQHTISFSAPPEAFPSDTRITIATFSVATDPRISHCPGANARLCGGDNNLAFEITADPATQPRLPLFFTVNYRPGSGEPAVAGMADPKQAVMLRFDTISCRCVPVRSPTAPTSQSITAQLNHLSIFQVGTVLPSSTPEQMRIYPNPYYAARDGWLTIDGLPAFSRVRLFTLRGEMVLDSSADMHGIFTWQGTNRGGRLVASGVYLVVVEGNGIKTIRKLVLLK
ncbi:MAG: hypothetical protein HY926_04545 [Elusimicrobia bacterium]|nr:hypothetical protein [Elusimicrobiota bacterium]